MRAQRYAFRSVARHLALAAALALVSGPGPALAARPAATPQSDCQQLLELYTACHRLGAQADSVVTCQEAAQDYVARAEARTGGKNPQAAHALAELVCTTGCEDGVSGQPPATAREFAEAFCDTAPVAKPQGGRP